MVCGGGGGNGPLAEKGSCNCKESQHRVHSPNPIQNEDPKYLFPEEINLYCIIKLAT